MNGHHKEDQRAAGVNVELAEAEFAELSRHLSSTSQPRSGNKERSGETDVSHNTNGDLEKGEDAVYGGCSQEKKDEESFDLEAMLRGAKSEDEEAGVKSKQIGVLWDGLTVSGFGGTKVCTYCALYCLFFGPEILPRLRTLLQYLCLTSSIVLG